MMGGYMGKLLFVDLSRREVKDESLDEKLCCDFIGGVGFGAKLLFDRQKGGVDPLGPENTLSFITGPLTGTPALFGSRYEVVGKSPLTGTWGQANSGGDFGPHLKFAGYDAIFLTGASEKPVYLFIKDGVAEIRDAQQLWGRDTAETEDMLKGELGEEVRVAGIGPAGEKLSLISCIINNKGRAIARSGLGALMGSKKLKAVAVLGTMEVPLADKKKANELRRKYLAEMKSPSGEFKHPTIESLRKFGTIGNNALFVRVGSSPVKNWGGVGVNDFPNAAAISDVNVLNFEAKKYGCYRCPLACGGLMKAGTEYKYEAHVHKPEYETATFFGTMCLNDNLESIIMANDICNRYGLDTISTGSTIAFAIECYQNHIITSKDTDGIELNWGNHRAIVALTEKMAKREGFGDILADGSKAAAEKIGKGAEKYAMHVRGQELPCGDPRGMPSKAAVLITGAAPGQHMRGSVKWVESGLGPQGMEFPPLEKYTYSGKGQIDAWMRKYYHAVEAAGICLLGDWGLSVDSILNQLAAVTGQEYSLEELLKVGERIACCSQAFNVREGLKPADFKLPARVTGHPPLKEGPNANVTLDVANMVKEFFEAMEWDAETGKPSKKKLDELDLEGVAKELWP